MDELVFGNWRVCEEIGRGGFGYVRRIEREDGFGGTQECALKVVHIEPEQPRENALQDMLREVRSEVESMIRFKGTSNIVSYEDHALIPMERGGAVVACRLELRMELLDSLTTLLAQDIRAIMNEPTVLRIGIDLCQALILCHSQNILHRDIKPSNIFRNRFGNYKLGDFGIARLLDESRHDARGHGAVRRAGGVPQRTLRPARGSVFSGHRAVCPAEQRQSAAPVAGADECASGDRAAVRRACVRSAVAGERGHGSGDLKGVRL